MLRFNPQNELQPWFEYYNRHPHVGDAIELDEDATEILENKCLKISVKNECDTRVVVYPPIEATDQKRDPCIYVKVNIGVATTGIFLYQKDLDRAQEKSLDLIPLKIFEDEVVLDLGE